MIPRMIERLHFVGVAGSGMSALAQFHVARGGLATGSDRFFDRGEHPHIRAALERAGVRIVAQDGSSLEECDGLVVSTAIEESVPDIAEARRRGIPILHRSELLASLVEQHRTLAVTGTSGKSTVTAMLFEILEFAGLSPSVLSGAELPRLQARGLLGNAYAGAGDLLVIEADESDGSLVRYRPWLGLVLNLRRDHKEPEDLLAMFRAFKQHTTGPFVASLDPALDPIATNAIRFGLREADDSSRPAPAKAILATDLELLPDRSRFRIDGVPFELPAPGEHNAFDAVAAAVAALQTGVTLLQCANALIGFQGVARRFQSHGSAAGIEVIDDFAHNPHKIEAALRTAQLRAPRVLAVFQPHGFGPTRFIREELVETIARVLRPHDILWLLEIFYAGGTATKDLSSSEIAADMRRHGSDARFAASRPELIEEIRTEARAGDVVLVMGARDPSLPELCRNLVHSLDN
jgi:UDP-N-acetylmuramate-alanine ligase